jgi:integrase
MALHKRGNIWYYDFQKNGRRYQGPTGQTNKNKAREVEDKLKTDIALQKFGIAPKAGVPRLGRFLADDGPFVDHIKRHNKPSTARQYARKCRQLVSWPEWRDMPISDVARLTDRYAAWREKKIGRFTLADELTVLRIALNLARDWGLMAAAKITVPPRPEGRKFVVSYELEREYLAEASYPLNYAAVLLIELGLRPEECCRIQKAEVQPEALFVPYGKTKNACRAIPWTARAKAAVDELMLLFPESEWLFPSRKTANHYLPKSLSDAHAKLRRKLGLPKTFVLYSFRHTFGTHLAESGASPYEITQLMGHADIRMSSHYIHPSAEGLMLAMHRREELAKAIRGDKEAIESLQKTLQRSIND